MNQAIQVLDGCAYIVAKDALKVDLIAAGQMLGCYISGSDVESLITLYNTKQFEIEEIIERKFDQDKVNEDGEIWLTVEEVYSY
jgi:Zn-dependent alcohol dehydrogenase